MLDNFCTGKRSNLAHLEGKVELVEGDLVDRAAVERALNGVKIVFHQAALASVPRSVAAPLDTNCGLRDGHGQSARRRPASAA